MHTTDHARAVGQAGEQAFKEFNKNIVEMHHFSISTLDPWCCAPPQIFSFSQMGSRKLSKSRPFLTHLQHRLSFQWFLVDQFFTFGLVWRCLDLKMDVYVNIIDKKARVVSLLGIVEVKRHNTLFSQKLWAISCFQWVKFSTSPSRSMTLFPRKRTSIISCFD